MTKSFFVAQVPLIIFLKRRFDKRDALLFVSGLKRLKKPLFFHQKGADPSNRLRLVVLQAVGHRHDQGAFDGPFLCFQRLCEPQVRDVVELYEEPKPHINTIATMFQNLEKKGYLTHVVKGRGYIYTAIVRKQDYGRTKLGSFVSRYFDNSYLNVVSTLVKEEKINREELLDYLETLKQTK